MKKTAIVIGGGWAGLSAAVELADRGFQVTVLEQSGRLGGRASSFYDEKSGETVDNGQHLFMGCYAHTIRFLDKIGSLDKLAFQKNLSVDFVDTDSRAFRLKCWPLPGPLHLFGGLWGLDSLSLREKWAARKVYLAVKSWKGGDSFKALTAAQWLKGLGQSDRSLRHFWDPVIIATLNELSSVADADSLALVLREAFFGDRKRSRIGIATVGLSELCGPTAVQYLSRRGGEVLHNQLVTAIDVRDGRVRQLTMRDGSARAADVYVSAVPFFILKNLLPETLLKEPFFFGIQNLTASPIFSVTLWFDREITSRLFAGLLDTRAQWLFNKTKIMETSRTHGYVTLVISAAREHLDKTNDQILAFCLDELRRCFPRSRDARLLKWLIQREKNATLSPCVGHSRHRPPQKTPIENFFLCGDWTDTGFPATIESAVLSGVKAAESAL